MKKILIMIIILGFATTVNAGLFDKIKDAAKDAADQSAPVKPDQPGIKQETPQQTEGSATGSQPAQPSGTKKAADPGISPDQQDANDCSKFSHEDYRKGKSDQEKSTLRDGSSRYLPKQEWVDYLKARYPNMHKTPDGYRYSFGKWFGISCADASLTCPKSAPGCDLNVRCYDFATRKGIKTCPINVCDSKDTKCLEKYKQDK
jgi:hypothetical protein